MVISSRSWSLPVWLRRPLGDRRAPDLTPRMAVETGKRLVEEQQDRFARQRRAIATRCCSPARQRVRPGSGQMFDLHPLEPLLHQLLPGRPLQVPHSETDIVGHVKMREQRIIRSVAERQLYALTQNAECHLTAQLPNFQNWERSPSAKRPNFCHSPTSPQFWKADENRDRSQSREPRRDGY
jgi:hypothetical protein